MDDDRKRFDTLVAEREQYITRIFWIGLEIAIIFAIPLAGAVALIKLVTDGVWSWIVIITAFVLSWALVIRRYLMINKKMTHLDREIKTLRQKLGIPERKGRTYTDEEDKDND